MDVAGVNIEVEEVAMVGLTLEAVVSTLPFIILPIRVIPQIALFLLHKVMAAHLVKFIIPIRHKTEMCMHPAIKVPLQDSAIETQQIPQLGIICQDLCLSVKFVLAEVVLLTSVGRGGIIHIKLRMISRKL